MKGEDLFDIFSDMFPDLSDAVNNYEKIGSKSIILKMRNGKNLFFLYYSRDNWSLGTKMWRKLPSDFKGGK